MRKKIALSVILAAIKLLFSSFPAIAAQQSLVDREALIQIGKDMDIENRLNWNIPPANTNPGDGGEWYGVEWTASPDARVIRLNYLYDKGFSVVSGAFGRLNDLEEITMGWNVLHDIKGLAGLKNLSYLQLNNNYIEDISALSTLPRLTQLWLQNNRIADIQPILESPLLGIVLLGNNQISEIGDFNMPSLQILGLDDNKISKIGDMNRSKSLRSLGLSNNLLRSIDSMKALPALESISIDFNYLSDADILLSSPRLKRIMLHDNRIPLSRLHPLMFCKEVYFGGQYDVELPALAPPVSVGKRYDLRSESVFDGQLTTFVLVYVDGKLAEEGVEYTLQEGYLTFLKPGEYKLRMYNDAIYNKGRITLVDEYLPRQDQWSSRKDEHSRLVRTVRPKIEAYADFDAKINLRDLFMQAVVHTGVLEVR